MYVGMNRAGYPSEGDGGSVPHVRGDEPQAQRPSATRAARSPCTWG